MWDGFGLQTAGMMRDKMSVLEEIIDRYVVSETLD
jgi:hypothetical protein